MHSRRNVVSKERPCKNQKGVKCPLKKGQLLRRESPAFLQRAYLLHLETNQQGTSPRKRPSVKERTGEEPHKENPCRVNRSPDYWTARLHRASSKRKKEGAVRAESERPLASPEKKRRRGEATGPGAQSRSRKK